MRRQNQRRAPLHAPHRLRQRGTPVAMLLSERLVHDQKGANILAPSLPTAHELIVGHGYDNNPLRSALAERGIAG